MYHYLCDSFTARRRRSLPGVPAPTLLGCLAAETGSNKKKKNDNNKCKANNDSTNNNIE